jgi:hypothetical protein
MPTGIANSTDTSALPSPSLPPGTAWFVNNSAASNTITYVGTVVVGGPGAGTVGIATNSITSAHVLTFASSIFPIGGGITSVLQLTNNAGALDGSFVYVANINAAGTFLGYQISQFDSSQTTGFANSTDTSAVAEPTIPVAGGFYFNNQTGGTVNWVQSL